MNSKNGDVTFHEPRKDMLCNLAINVHQVQANTRENILSDIRVHLPLLIQDLPQVIKGKSVLGYFLLQLTLHSLKQFPIIGHIE